MKFAYSASGPGGKTEAGEIDGGDIVEAIEGLRRKGLVVSKITPAASRGGFVRRRMGRGRMLRNLAMFTRQLYVLTSTGTTLVDALRSLERQSRDRAWREVVGEVRDKVERGVPLSEAMSQHPQCFDAVCRSLISAGESGGGLDKMLDRVAMLSRKQLQLRTAIIGAMTYPVLLIFIAMGVLALMLVFVLPRFAGLFESMNVPLPATTQFLMDLSAFLQAWWWAVGIGVVVAGVGAKFWAATQSGRAVVHKAVLYAPVAGRLVRSLQIARIIRVLGVLVAGRVPLLQSLGLARLSAGNLLYAKLMANAEAAVIGGSTISSVLAESDLVEPSLCEAIRSGEKSGEMASLLLSMADFLDEENEVMVRSLTSILEPMILIVLGAVVGLVAMSMFLPMFDMTSMTQRR
ncbi:MAG TPA: type II secretion system F family protein [Tepidisphaeraceae bacterium]|jgi:type II secretory pathway component PulF|nr:type II secretion system F family protein [Tepidisphaeraceae bacterium]